MTAIFVCIAFALAIFGPLYWKWEYTVPKRRYHRMLYELLNNESRTEEYKKHLALDGEYHTENIVAFDTIQFIKLGKKFNLIDDIGKTATFISDSSLKSKKEVTVNDMQFKIQFRASSHGIFKIREYGNFEKFHRNLCKLQRQDAIKRFFRHTATISTISGLVTGSVIAFLYPISEDISFSLMLQNFWNSICEALTPYLVIHPN